MAPKVTKNRLLGDSFLLSGKISYSQNYLENPTGEWRVRSLNRSNTASFLGTGADGCQFCPLGHVVFKKCYFYIVGLCCYIRKVISVHLKPCSSRETDTAQEANRKPQRE